MLGPSPDWVVGINGLNLCLKNCTWTENLVIDLFPYDAGTDGGVTYMVFALELEIYFIIIYVHMPPLFVTICN